MTHTILDFRFGILDWGVSDHLIGPEVELIPVQTKMMQARLSQPGAASSPGAGQPAATLPSEQDPLKHLLIGSPRAIQQTIHRLHNLGYAEVGFWSPLIAIPQQQLIITANPGEMMSLLMRSLHFE
jgi:hypothetical protein